MITELDRQLLRDFLYAARVASRELKSGGYEDGYSAADRLDRAATNLELKSTLLLLEVVP